MQASDKIIKQLEQRLKDLNTSLKAKNSETKAYEDTLVNIENLQKKAKVEGDKIKRERDEFKK